MYIANNNGLIWTVLSTNKSAVSQVTVIEIESFDQTLKILLVQGHPVVFGKNVYYRREEEYLFYLKNAGSHFMLFVKYS